MKFIKIEVITHINVHDIKTEFNLKSICSLAGWILKATAGSSSTMDLAKWHRKWRSGSRTGETWVDTMVYWQISFTRRKSIIKVFHFHSNKPLLLKKKSQILLGRTGKDKLSFRSMSSFSNILIMVQRLINQLSGKKKVIILPKDQHRLSSWTMNLLWIVYNYTSDNL